MRRADPSSCEPLLAAERAILKCLCRDEQLARISPDQLTRLRHYAWADPEHRIVFDAIQRSAKATGFSLREYLPAEATRMGFPDVHWDAYFENNSDELTRPQAEPPQTLNGLNELIDALIQQAKRA